MCRLNAVCLVALSQSKDTRGRTLVTLSQFILGELLLCCLAYTQNKSTNVYVHTQILEVSLTLTDIHT